MRTNDIPYRYAKALFYLSSSHDELKQWLQKLQELIFIIFDHDKIKSFFLSPQVEKQEKEKILSKALKDKTEKKFLDFLSLLILNDRFSYLPEIAKIFKKLVEHTLGILEGSLITPKTLDKATFERLKLDLEKIYRKKVYLQEKSDPTLIGGGILMFGNRIIDFSIKNKLERLKRALLKG